MCFAWHKAMPFDPATLYAYRGLPLPVLQSKLQEFSEQAKNASMNKSYSINGKSVMRADERWLTDQIIALNTEIRRITGNGSKQIQVMNIDRS